MWIALNKNLKAAGEKLINNHQDAIEPQMPLIFNALKKVKVEDIKVVILGQDPTPQEGKAKGVAFLVDNPRTVPAVLNMLLEVAFEGFAVDLDRANVEEWLKKGVLLLNTNLNEHLIVTGRHPSTMGGTTGEGNTFFGGNYFNIANQFLEIKRRGAIDWSLSSTGRNGLDLRLCPQTRIELQQRENEEQQLRNQQQQNQHHINLIEQKITEIQQEQQKIVNRHQTIENALNQNAPPLSQPQRSQFEKEIQTLQQNYDSLNNNIHNYQGQLQQLQIQQPKIEEEMKQNLITQHLLGGLPLHLLKQNYQKQINGIDEELNQLRRKPKQ